ncbi:MAG: tetratricopeptide repeat protein [Rhodospirillales bacterium]|nr:tetratricopeptide repeat protein [Rhodospirillales bacterium]
MSRRTRRRQSAASTGRARASDPAAAHADVLARAARQMKEGRPHRADQLLTKLLAGDGAEDPSVLHYAGVARYRCSRFDEAAGLLRQATEAAPTYAEAHNSLGILLLETGETAEARAVLERAVALRPDYANAHTNLGNALSTAGQLEEAATVYRRAIALDPYDLQAHHRLARTHLALGALEPTLAACTAALAIDPFCQNALATRALAEQIGGDDDGSSGLYDFDRFVTRVSLTPPPGSGDIEAFNEALTTAVREAPSLVWEPPNRVTRNGAVTQDLLATPSAPIRNLERALRAAIDAYRETLTADPESPFLARIPRRYRLTLIASILTAGGRHPPHIHESAWLSGVYYVAVPPQIGTESTEHGGWLEFGRPDHDLPQGSPVRFVSYPPRAGTALLFPSYVFHGTLPFEGPGERIGIAFDAYPEP